jgi:hypothetical protein
MATTKPPIGHLPLTLALALLAGCAGGGGGDAANAARDREAAKATWMLAIDDAGATHEAPLERMDVYLTEDDAEPEIFEIRGDGVVLVGRIPPEMAVGYGEEFENLVGKDLPIEASGGDPGDPKSSSVTILGMSAPVAGGTLHVEKFTGTWSGSEGDKTLHGVVELRVPAADGERTVRGRIAVHIVTWG